MLFFLCSSDLFSGASLSQTVPCQHLPLLLLMQTEKCCQKLEPLSLCDISNSGNASYRMFSAQANWKIQKPPENNVLAGLRESYVWFQYVVDMIAKMIRDINAHAGYMGVQE